MKRSIAFSLLAGVACRVLPRSHTQSTRATQLHLFKAINTIRAPGPSYRGPAWDADEESWS